MLTKTRRGAADISRAPSGFSLENQFAAELENPRVKGTVCDSKIRAGYGRAQETIELSVIERVEAVNAELESSRSVNAKDLYTEVLKLVRPGPTTASLPASPKPRFGPPDQDGTGCEKPAEDTH